MPYSLTFTDAIDHLLAYAGGNFGVNADSRLMRAIDSGYRELTEVRNWAYLYRTDQILTDAPYTTGTLAYTASTRTVALTGGTWPSWAQYGWLYGLSGTTLIPVEARSSGSDLILDADYAPPDNGTASSYRLYHIEYPLDEDFQSLGTVLEQNGVWGQTYLDHGDWLALTTNNQGSGAPFGWTIGDSRSNLYRLSAFIYPPPDIARKLQYVYKRRARPLKVTGKAAVDFQGTVTTSGTAVTGTGTAFNQNHVGSIIRFAVTGAANPPSGALTNDPYEYEGRIKTVTNATSAVLESALSSDVTSRKYRLSDPIDVNPSIQEAFFRYIETEWCILADSDRVNQAEQLKQLAYERACDRDRTDFQRRFAGKSEFDWPWGVWR